MYSLSVRASASAEVMSGSSCLREVRSICGELQMLMPLLEAQSTGLTAPCLLLPSPEARLRYGPTALANTDFECTGSLFRLVQYPDSILRLWLSMWEVLLFESVKLPYQVLCIHSRDWAIKLGEEGWNAFPPIIGLATSTASS